MPGLIETTDEVAGAISKFEVKAVSFIRRERELGNIVERRLNLKVVSRRNSRY